MSEKTYATVAGFVQFDPQERDVNGKTVRDVTVKAIGSQKLVRITVWPEHSETEIDKGHFLVADGVFSTSTGQGKDGGSREYLNLSAGTLLSLPSAPKKEREVVAASSAGSKSDDQVPF